MREEQSAPLANLSAVNYGNLPSCLSGFATSLPFMSKSKPRICSIGTFPFLQGHWLHKCLMMTADIYSMPGLGLPLQTYQPNKHTQVPTTSPKGKYKSLSNSLAGVCFPLTMKCVNLVSISESQYVSVCFDIQ